MRRSHFSSRLAARFPPEHTPLLLFNVPVKLVTEATSFCRGLLVTDCPFSLWVWSGFLVGAALSSVGCS